MLRLILLAVAAIVVVAVGWVVLPRSTSRPEANLSTPVASPADPNAFVVHDAPPPSAPLPPVPTAPQAATAQSGVAQTGAAQTATPQPDGPATPDLDAAMQRLRAANADSSAGAPALPPTQPQLAAPPPVITPTPPQTTPAAPPPASRWTNVTAQGGRWRMVSSATGYTIEIDLGASRVAQVHVAPAFAQLASPAMNQRVDYLKQTILQNFPPESASYTFARDGSVSLDN